MHTAARGLTTPILVLHLVTKLPISVSSFTFASPTFRAPTALCAVLKLSIVIAAFSKYRPNGKTRCFGFGAALKRLWTSAPSE